MVEPQVISKLPEVALPDASFIERYPSFEYDVIVVSPSKPSLTLKFRTTSSPVRFTVLYFLSFTLTAISLPVSNAVTATLLSAAKALPTV